MSINDVMKRAQIAAPCHVDWDTMSGDEKTRFCGDCKQNVYNASEMTDEEVLQLLERAKSGSRVCMQIYRRDDGTFLTKNCPVGLQRLRERAFAAVRKTAGWIAGTLSLAVSLAASAAPTSSSGTATGLAPNATPPQKKPTWKSTIKGDCPPVPKAVKGGAGSSTKNPVVHAPMRGQMIVLPSAEDIRFQIQEMKRIKSEKPDSIEAADAIVQLCSSYEILNRPEESVPLRLEAMKVYEAKGATAQASYCYWALSTSYARLKDTKNSQLFKHKYDEAQAKTAVAK